MKRLAVLLFVAAMALATFPHGTALAAGDTVNITMNAQNGSSENGTATITSVSANDIKVMVTLNNGSSTPQPAHIHKGTCANLDPVPYQPLTNVVNGSSDTTVMIGMAQLASGTYAINVHKSAAEVSTYVSCGDIHASSMSGGSMAGGTTTGGSMAGGSMAGGSMAGGSSMPNTGNGDQPMFLLGLALLALSLTGVGLRLSRKRA
ncbi:MAG: LPXTG cell wall anchor domain-containing protein [Chloroflexia bacterium]